MRLLSYDLWECFCNLRKRFCDLRKRFCDLRKRFCDFFCRCSPSPSPLPPPPSSSSPPSFLPPLLLLLPFPPPPPRSSVLWILLLLLSTGTPAAKVAEMIRHYELDQIEGGSVQCPISGLRFPLSVWFKGRSSIDFAEILRVEDEDQMRNLSRHRITFDTYQYLHLYNLHLSDEGEYKVIADSPEEVLLHMTVNIKPSFKVIGPQAPMQVIIGEDVVLPCSLVPPLSAEGILVRWFQNNNFESLVHLYENGKDQNEHQLPKYQGRTEMIKDHIANGNISLRIRNTTKSDGGSYTCHVQYEVYEEATLELKVGSPEEITSDSAQTDTSRPPDANFTSATERSRYWLIAAGLSVVLPVLVCCIGWKFKRGVTQAVDIPKCLHQNDTEEARSHQQES